MKFVSWNVNGLRAIMAKGFSEIFAGLDADFFCLQETKLSPGVATPEFAGYRSFWNLAEKKGYSGTAIYTRHEPLSVTNGIGCTGMDNEGRVITLEMPAFYLVTVYTPNSQSTLARLPFRLQWDEAFREYVVGLDGCKPVIICGDLNVVRNEIDAANFNESLGGACFTDCEREGLEKLLGNRFIDAFRTLHPDRTDIYTWWSYRMRARQRNLGWLIDRFLVSRRIGSRITAAEILPDITGSDHCPITLTLSSEAD